MSVTDVIAMLLSCAGLFVVLCAAIVTRMLRAGVPMMLELWTAAGLLKLAGDPSWSTVAIAAAMIALRHLTSAALRQRLRPGRC